MAFQAKLRGVISYSELEQIRSELARKREALYEQFGPRTYPVAAFREEAKKLTPRETLDVFGIAATVTRETLELSIA